MTVYSVGQVNSYIRGLFEQDVSLRSIHIKGELSNVKYHSSGHIYFTLKDNRAACAGVMFAGNRGGLTFHMKEGQQVIVSGSVNVYERDGKYQIYATEIVLEGTGLLYERYEKLRAELAEMGMFDPVYKQSIPRFIRTLGIVTAPTGAAVQDVIHIAKRRNPYLQIILYPALVQGEGAPASIVNGIHALEQHNVDVMIVGRGGGSIEDLWAFNEEIVARAIFDCSVPIISAVGHETDTTIADWVADLRAPTPSAAAELAIYPYVDFIRHCLDSRSQVQHLFRQKLLLYKGMAERYGMRIEHLSPQSRIRERRMQLVDFEEQMRQAMTDRLTDRRHRMAIYVERMKGLSPLLKLNQGFSMVEGADGRTVTDISQVKKSDQLNIHVRNGEIRAQVLDTKGVER